MIYAKLAADFDYDDISFSYDDYDKQCKIEQYSWLSDDFPEAYAWLQGHQDTISQLRLACQYDNCFFGYDPDDPVLRPKGHPGSKLQIYQELLKIAAKNDIAHDRRDDALDKYRVILKMADHLGQCPGTFQYLTSLTIEANTYEQIREFIMDAKPSAGEIGEIKELLEVIDRDWDEVWPKLVDIEKMQNYQSLYQMYQINEQGKTRFTRIPYWQIVPEGYVKLESLHWGQGNNEEREKSALGKAENEDADEKADDGGKAAEKDYWEIKKNKLRSFAFWFFLPADPTEAAEELELVFGKYYAINEKFWQTGPIEIRPANIRLRYPDIVDMIHYKGSVPEIDAIHQKYERQCSEKKAVQIMIGLYNHRSKTGVWPDSLDEIEIDAEMLVDSVDGDTFGYKRKDDSFMLYSKGENGIDDGGQNRTILETKKALVISDGIFNSSNSQEVKIMKVYDDYVFWPARSRRDETGVVKQAVQSEM